MASGNKTTTRCWTSQNSWFIIMRFLVNSDKCLMTLMLYDGCGYWMLITVHCDIWWLQTTATYNLPCRSGIAKHFIIGHSLCGVCEHHPVDHGNSSRPSSALRRTSSVTGPLLDFSLGEPSADLMASRHPAGIDGRQLPAMAYSSWESLLGSPSASPWLQKPPSVARTAKALSPSCIRNSEASLLNFKVPTLKPPRSRRNKQRNITQKGPNKWIW